MNRQSFLGVFPLALAMLASLLGTAQVGRAASFTWNGGGSDSNWTTVANWSATGATNFVGTNAYTIGTGLGSGSNLVLNGDKTIQSLNLSLASNFTISGSTLTLVSNLTRSAAGGSQTINSAISLASNVTLVVSGGSSSNNSFVINGAIGEAGAGRSLTITVNASRFLQLNGNNTYTGGTVINNPGNLLLAGSNASPVTLSGPSTGTLTIGNNTALGTGVFTWISGGLGANGARVLANPIQVGSAGGTNTFTVSTGNKLTFTGLITLVSNAVFYSGGSATGDAGAPVFAGGITDGGSNYSLTLLGSTSRILIISNQSSYGGGTFISPNGANLITVKLGVNDGLPTSGALVVDSTGNVGGGGFWLNGFNQTIGSLSGTGSIALGSGTLTTGDATDTTWGGSFLSSGGRLVKRGSGTFTLGSTNRHTGGTTISNGTLKLGVINALLSDSAVTVAGGVYDLGGFAAVTNGLVTIAGGAISNGTLLSSSNFLATDSGTISAGLSGDAGLIKTGSGTLVLNGNSAYAGATLVSNGTLRVNGVSSGTGGLTVHSNATLGGTGSVRGVTLADGGTLAPGNSIGTLTVSNLTLNTGSLFDFELAATNASDKVLDLGTLTLAQLSFANFTFTTNAGFGEGTYTLIDAALHSSTFATVTNESFYGYLATLSLGGADGHDLVLGVTMAIPEPSALLALAGGGAALVLLRRRRA